MDIALLGKYWLVTGTVVVTVLSFIKTNRWPQLPYITIFLLLGICIGAIVRQAQWLPISLIELLAIPAYVALFVYFFLLGNWRDNTDLDTQQPLATLVWLEVLAINLILAYVSAYYILNLSVNVSLAIAIGLALGIGSPLHGIGKPGDDATVKSAVLFEALGDKNAKLGFIVMMFFVAIYPSLKAGAQIDWVALSKKLGALVLAIIACMQFSRNMAERFYRFNNRWAGRGVFDSPFITIAGGGLVLSALVKYAGLPLIFGSFAAGLAFRQVEALRKYCQRGYLFFSPFLFLSIGAEVDLTIAIDQWRQIVEWLILLFWLNLFASLPALFVVEEQRGLLAGLKLMTRGEFLLLLLYLTKQTSLFDVTDELYSILVVTLALNCFLPQLGTGKAVQAD